ncbi:hypothetical protein B0T25DRAFT_523387 [Lasiosphaeria hispida]|uniref:Uncharacterized protein n=1 Tax=Lasiosphaeria hispida TaxID=260671 RepID=A0AAJ0H4U7_9PEZI|nr:hypothetical protein B0T25DRAFT_523387 [Lasiosphaeria hispida]
MRYIDRTGPSSTFFQTTDSDSWPMHVNADPLNGLSWKEVEETSSGLATADLHGKLFYYLRGVLGAFLRLSGSHVITFRLYQMDAFDSPKHTENATFIQSG